MSRDEIKETLLNSQLIEIDDKTMGKYYQSHLFVAYNKTEAWTFHLTRTASGDIFTATKVRPNIETMIEFEDVPDYVLNMELDWSDNICAKYGDVIKAMQLYGK